MGTNRMSKLCCKVKHLELMSSMPNEFHSSRVIFEVADPGFPRGGRQPLNLVQKPIISARQQSGMGLGRGWGLGREMGD